MTSRLLDPAAVAAYRRDGIYFPVCVFNQEEAGRMLGHSEAVEAAHGGRLPARVNQKLNVLYAGAAKPGKLGAAIVVSK